ncbi:MAG: hypothetical protein IPG90_07685 [Bacteroidetes bacterium]|nr:hypothetical protein [Bacteroidota bacterium]
MFDNLLQLIKENAGESIINNPAIPNEKNDAAIQVAGEGIMNQLKGVLAGGGMQNLMEMFGAEIQPAILWLDRSAIMLLNP